MVKKSTPFTLVVTEVASEGSFLVVVDPGTLEVIQGSVASYMVSFTDVLNFDAEVDLSVLGLPLGAVATFDINPANVGDVVVMTISTVDVEAGSYSLTLEANEVVV